MPLFFKSFKWLLVGYALFGRSFAYIGVPPLFIGEIFLGWGIVRAPIARMIGRLFAVPSFVLLFFFMLYCAALTLAGMHNFKAVDVLRDGAIWGYGIFAVIVAAYCLRTPDLLLRSLEAYRRFASLYIFAALMLVLAGFVLGSNIPNVPGTTIPILTQKSSDTQVHLAGVIGLAYIGLLRLTPLQSCALMIGVLMHGSLNRGGLLSIFCAITFLMVVRPRLRFILYMFGALIFVLSFFTFVKIELNLFGRTISTEQVGENILSIFGDSSDPYGLSGTRQWRLDWWHQIVQYTFHGDYFWSGKGFGINLAEDDGIIDVLADQGEPLRSPHSAHLTFLARGGVPLFFFWIALQLSWVIGMLRTMFRARARGDQLCEKITMFLLAYWIAMIVNMSFDVYLEGPMGGIWFWTIWGYGLAVMWLYRYRPQSLAQTVPSGTGTPPLFAPQPAE